MTIFVPDWPRPSGRDLQIKRVLNVLDDAHVVRRPLPARGCAADMLVQHPAKGWLALWVATAGFAELDPSRLFDSDEHARFEQRLTALQRLAVPVLVILWSCSIEQARSLGRAALMRFGTRLVSREQFLQLGTKLVAGLLEPLPEVASQQLLGICFPETEIPAVCTTRRFIARDDNSARLQRWFLDADQEWATKLDLDLPRDDVEVAGDFSVRLVNGVAGSGKTLIAVQRALLLAELFPQQRVLLLIHNTPIVADLLDRLKRAHGDLPTNLEVMTFFAWVTRQWRRVFGAQPQMAQAGDVAACVQHLRQRWPDLRLSVDQVLAELNFINDSMLGDEAAYLATARSGRGFSLRAAERSMVWALSRAVEGHLHRRGLQLWSALPGLLVVAAERHDALQRFEHVLIDEAQFCAPSWFELVKRSLAARGQLFLCADPKQGFMGHRLSWKSAGLEVAGRTKRLHRSYRTTQALLASASALVDAVAPLDGEDEDLTPDFAGMEAGTRPLLLYVASPQDAVDRLVNELSALADEGLPLGAFLVVYGDNTNKSALHAQLVKRFGFPSVWWFNHHAQKKAPPGGRGQDHLRMAYLDSATGLEASVVFLLGAERLFVAQASGDDAALPARKLYMALTRAGHKLVLMSSQRLAPPIEALFELPPGDVA